VKHRLIHGPDFKVVNGPLAGRSYKRGQTYDEIPAELADQFEPVKPPAAAPNKKAKRGGDKK